MSERRTAVLLLLAGALAAAAAACSKSKSAATPATESPTARCLVLWATAAAANPSAVNVFEIAGEAANWTAGAHSFGSGATSALFLYGATVDSNGAITTVTASAQATSGSYTETGAQPDHGALTVATSAGGYAFFALDAGGQAGAQVGSGGAGSFSGSWSAPTGVPALGSGTVALSYLGSALTLGNSFSFATCP